MANIFSKWFGKKNDKENDKIQEAVVEQVTPDVTENQVEENKIELKTDDVKSNEEEVNYGGEKLEVEENKIEESIEKTQEVEIVEETVELPKEVELQQSGIQEIVEQEQDAQEIQQVAEKTFEEQTELNFVEKPQGLFNRLKEGLSKTSKSIKEKFDGILANFRKIDEQLFEELEEMLITSDIGVQTTQTIIEDIKKKVKLRNITDPSEIKNILKEEIKSILADNNYELNTSTSPSVVLVVGVNGVGKTTSIGKISHRLKQSGKKVLLAAGDTFRAAAIDQLEIWGKRAGVEIIKHNEGADPGAVIFDAVQAAKARKMDVIICDTAGRLHNKKNLMDELGKVHRIVDRELPDCSKEVLLVLDATTGQNAVQQAKTFNESTKLTGIILTKLDGTAKGGIVITIKSELNIPIKFIGVGEGMDDLQQFNPDNFVDALFE